LISLNCESEGETETSTTDPDEKSKKPLIVLNGQKNLLTRVELFYSENKF
jgi:hypothetical protein